MMKQYIMRRSCIFIVLFILITTTIVIAQTRRPRDLEFVKKIANIEEMQTLMATIRVCDPDGDAVMISIDDLPYGSILSDTYPLTSFPDPCECNNEPDCIECVQNPDITSWYGADLQWTPNYEQQGNYSLHVHAVDSNGGDDWVVFIINVANKNRSPVL